jgi:hypothetical protein
MRAKDFGKEELERLYLQHASIRRVAEVIGVNREILRKRYHALDIETGTGWQNEYVRSQKLVNWIELLARNEVDEVIDQIADILDQREQKKAA